MVIASPLLEHMFLILSSYRFRRFPSIQGLSIAAWLSER
jgi:hypothetical protein